VKLWVLPKQKDRSFERSRLNRNMEGQVGKNTEACPLARCQGGLNRVLHGFSWKCAVLPII
jgi:hypothetical protein